MLRRMLMRWRPCAPVSAASIPLSEGSSARRLASNSSPNTSALGASQAKDDRISAICWVFIRMLFLNYRTYTWGGLEGPGTLWVPLQEPLFSPAVGDAIAHSGREKNFFGRGCTSPKPSPRKSCHIDLDHCFFHRRRILTY